MATIAKGEPIVNASPKRRRMAATDEAVTTAGARRLRHPTIADVAAAAGVSASTASRALRQSPLVRAETRRRVLDAAELLGFEPNRLARSLRTRSSLSVGVVVPDVATAFWAAALKGAQDVLERAGYLVLVMSSERDPAHERAALRTLRAHRVDGILLATSGGYETPAAVPVVFFDRLANGAGAGRVAPANREGTALLYEHLRGHGHVRIGYVGGYPGSTSADERLAALREAAAAAGLALPAGYVGHGDAAWSEASGERAAAEMLAASDRPTALIAASDTLAVGTLRAARRAGLRVPDDVALVSFDEPVFADLLDPPLTSLSRHDREIGELAARLLLRVLGGEDAAAIEIRVPLELKVRRSCGCNSRG
jgi:DNA-binding LacI/PurR family transcriptional regulator